MKALTSIEQRVEAKNFLNIERLRVLKEIKETFQGMKGQKVLLAGGGTSKKWVLKSDYIKTTKEINGIKIYFSYQHFFNFSHRSVSMRSKVCINGGSYDVRPATAFTQYVENSDYIGETESQILTEVDGINTSIENAEEEVKNPINLEDFYKQKEDYQKALNTISNIKNKVHYSLRDFLPKY